MHFCEVWACEKVWLRYRLWRHAAELALLSAYSCKYLPHRSQARAAKAGQIDLAYFGTRNMLRRETDLIRLKGSQKV